MTRRLIDYFVWTAGFLIGIWLAIGVAAAWWIVVRTALDDEPVRRTVCVQEVRP